MHCQIKQKDWIYQIKIFKQCSNLLEYHEALLDVYSCAITANSDERNINKQKMVLNELAIIKELKSLEGAIESISEFDNAMNELERAYQTILKQLKS